MNKKSAKTKRQLRVRSSIFGTSSRPRLAIFRSGKHTYAQIFDDSKGVTLIGASTHSQKSGTKTEKAVALSTVLVDALKKHKLNSLVFDRRSYRFHGRIKLLADALRQAGIKF